MDLIFCNIKRLKKRKFHFFCTLKISKYVFFFQASLKASKNMTLIFVSRLLESAQKTSIKFFASFKKLKKQEFDFFCKLKIHEYNCLQA